MQDNQTRFKFLTYSSLSALGNHHFSFQIGSSFGSSFILNEKIELYEEETSASKWHEHVYMHEYIYIMHKYE